MNNKTIACLLLCSSTMLNASELIYTPVNPSFGGHPNNSSHLMGVANAINTYKAPQSDSGIEEQSALDRLASSLESRLISQLLSDIGTGNTSGILDTQDFLLNVQDDGSGGLVINIQDKETGESTSISVSGLNPSN